MHEANFSSSVQERFVKSRVPQIVDIISITGTNLCWAFAEEKPLCSRPAAASRPRSETSLTSFIKIIMELNHCTAGPALAVIANTTVPTPGYESLPRASASNQISPQAPSTQTHLRYGSKTKTFSPKQTLSFSSRLQHPHFSSCPSWEEQM